MSRAKPGSANQQECDCGRKHFHIDEAIAHAKTDLGDELTDPVWGTRGGQIANVGRVIGFQSSDGQRRLRLDYDPKKGVHVNAEDFTRPPGRQKLVHLVRPPGSPTGPDAAAVWRHMAEARMQLYWNKWTSRYSKPPKVVEAEQEVDRQQRDG